MQTIPRRLKLLEKKLASLPADSGSMLVSELDGFLTGILVCPDLIMPSEWLPLVWGSDEDADPIFENAHQAEQLVGLVMEQYNAIAHDLQSGRFAPVFEVDTRHDEVLWELWIDGFESAMQLRPESWGALLQSDEDTRTALAGLILLTRINEGDSGLPEAEIEELTEKAPDLIGAWVEILNAWRVSQDLSPQLATPAPSFGKVGRNDPCPCGSGKKYKKCHGLS
ncbi:UPF0149 family protein [Microvirga sp. BT689]|uniref:UPF0149 family protein n=1 Tax=Microvirga arvi TaxID=2778731 RepID=UPI001951B313|nr:UPF0149 family protein [Microvirga arvi]MBM6584135.1 UPF0149 family protein [Microvirga arvi]